MKKTHLIELSGSKIAKIQYSYYPTKDQQNKYLAEFDKGRPWKGVIKGVCTGITILDESYNKRCIDFKSYDIEVLHEHITKYSEVMFYSADMEDCFG